MSDEGDNEVTSKDLQSEADDAGTENGYLCSLILADGWTALEVAIAGLSVVGRKQYGMYGLINVTQDTSHKNVADMFEIVDLMKITGLQYNVDYSSESERKKLRYGKLMMLTDQNEGGTHFKGLIISFIYSNWPALLHTTPPFLEEIITPVVKVTRGLNKLSFYSMAEFEQWKKTVINIDAYTVRHYRGLGTNNWNEIKEYFSNMDFHRVKFEYGGPEDDENLMKAFDKGAIKQLRGWLTHHMVKCKRHKLHGFQDSHLYTKKTNAVTYSDFINSEYVFFASYNNANSIPSVVDGFKPGQRKVLFTCIFCLTTRAIWMEIAHSMDTSSCIMCIDNFMLRKGRPREVFSDNGLSFHSSEKELSDEFAKVDQREIEEKFTNSEMVWKFNPPATPHMGGVWERLIRTVKTCLKETLRTRTPNDEMLKNLIVEAEFIVNSRPLTYVSLETADDEALTPNHILLGSSNGIKPLSNINERDLARNTYKAVQVLANNFWHRFVLEYLPTLTRRTKWFKPAEPIKVGDVVVVVDEKSQRNSWPKGIVEELLPGKKGIIRQVMIRTDRGIRKRSVSKLAVLDVKPPQPEVVNQEPMGSINGEGNVAQRHLNVNNNISSKNSTTTLPDSTDE